MVLFCPMYNQDLWKACPMNSANNVNGVGDCPSSHVYTLKHPDMLEVHDAVTRRIVQALKQLRQRVFMKFCNEPYFGGVTLEWQKHIAATNRGYRIETPEKST